MNIKLITYQQHRTFKQLLRRESENAVVEGVVPSRVVAAREDMASTGFDGIRVIGTNIAKIAICQWKI